jgi:hypothetical protein
MPASSAWPWLPPMPWPRSEPRRPRRCRSCELLDRASRGRSASCTQQQPLDLHRPRLDHPCHATDTPARARKVPAKCRALICGMTACWLQHQHQHQHRQRRRLRARSLGDQPERSMCQPQTGVTSPARAQDHEVRDRVAPVRGRRRPPLYRLLMIARAAVPTVSAHPPPGRGYVA